MIVFPAEWSILMISASFSFCMASWPTVGSSRTTTSGSQARIEARVSRFFSPPLSISGEDFRYSSSPKKSSAQSRRFSMSAVSKPKFFRA